MYPELNQVWAVVLPLSMVVGDGSKPLLRMDDPRLMEAVKSFLWEATDSVDDSVSAVTLMAPFLYPVTEYALSPYMTEYGSIRLRGWGYGVPKSTLEAPEHINTIPPFTASGALIDSTDSLQVVTVIVEFFYNGEKTQGDEWPWFTSGVLDPCPDKLTGGGLLAVLKPEAPPAYQPTPFEEHYLNPVRDAIVHTHDTTRDVVEDVSDAVSENMPEPLSDAMTLAMYGAVGVVLFNLYQATKTSA
jgi:hypothetical protein